MFYVVVLINSTIVVLINSTISSNGGGSDGVVSKNW